MEWVWGQPIIQIAAVVTAVGVIFKKVVVPIWRAAVAMNDLGPVIVDIAHEFKNNAGSSLRDSIDRIEEKVNKLDSYVHTFRHEESNRHEVVPHLAVQTLVQQVEKLQKQLDRLEAK